LLSHCQYSHGDEILVYRLIRVANTERWQKGKNEQTGPAMDRFGVCELRELHEWWLMWWSRRNDAYRTRLTVAVGKVAVTSALRCNSMAASQLNPTPAKVKNDLSRMNVPVGRLFAASYSVEPSGLLIEPIGWNVRS